MNTKQLLQTTALALTFGLPPSAFVMAVPLGTAFTYQGQLTEAAAPAHGNYDLKFTLYADAASGSAVAGPLTNSAVGVSNGLFTVTLDFGSAYDGNARWLQIGVRASGSAGDFATLTPRQPLTPSPYALYAPGAGTAATASSVAAANVTGTLAVAPGT